MVRRKRTITLTVLFAAACVLTLITIVAHGLGGHLLMAGQSEVAASVSPGDARVALVQAEGAVRRRALPQARRHALAAIEWAPMRPEATILLAFLEQAQGRALKAAEIVSKIGLLGWRHPGAQLWILRSAVDQGNMGAAVLRADAMLRQEYERDRLLPLLRRLAREPEARGAIAERLAADPPWRQTYLLDLKALRAQDFSTHWAILEELRTTETPPRVDEIAAFSSKLISQGLFVEAKQLWAKTAPRDGSFVDNHGSPFEWKPHALPGLNVEPGEGGAAATLPLRITMEGAIAGVALDRLMVLPAGSYGFRSELVPARKTDERPYRWRITCATGGQDIISSRSEREGRDGALVTELRFTIPPSCPAIRTALFIDHQGLNRDELVLRRATVSE